MEGPNSGCVANALEGTFEFFGAPKHIITDHGGVFIGTAFSELLRNWNVKLRFGAIGKHGSIAITERVIKTLKHEWIYRARLVKGFDHLTHLCQGFTNWYNIWRPHMALDCQRPDDVYY